VDPAETRRSLHHQRPTVTTAGVFQQAVDLHACVFTTDWSRRLALYPDIIGESADGTGHRPDPLRSGHWR
jgi:hypothetical protein